MKLMLLREINNLNKDIKKNVLKNNRSVAENFNLFSKNLLCLSQSLNCAILTLPAKNNSNHNKI